MFFSQSATPVQSWVMEQEGPTAVSRFWGWRATIPAVCGPLAVHGAACRAAKWARTWKQRLQRRGQKLWMLTSARWDWERYSSVGVCETAALHGVTHLTVSTIISSPFLPHSIPVSSSSSPSSSLSLFALLISLLLTFRCCHANFPGDSVVMETGQQGRSADVWCCSGVCTNQSPVFGLVLLRRPCFFCTPVPYSGCPPSTIHTAAMWLPTNTFYKI